jgi:pilus assembly protein Flp/PilA
MSLGIAGPWFCGCKRHPQNRGALPSLQGDHVHKLIYRLLVWRDSKGQDLIEYALMAGFVAVAAGAIMPNVAASISQIFSQVTSVLSNASGS